MSGLELNKIAGAVLLAGLIAMVIGTAADVLYHGNESPEKRGFEVAVAEGGSTPQKKEEEILDIATLMSNADLESGKKITKKCASCHSFDQGGPNKVGPALWGILNNKKAALSDFSYSDAMKAKEGTWSYDSLFAFLKKPKDYVPGTKMAFAGIKKPQQIADLVYYMRSQGDGDAPLPEVVATTQEESAIESIEEAVDNVAEEIEDVVDTAVEKTDNAVKDALEEGDTAQ